MMQGVDVGSQTLAAEQRCFDHGLVIETSGPNDEIVKVLPALTTPVDILEVGLTSCRTGGGKHPLCVEQAWLANGDGIG